VRKVLENPRDMQAGAFFSPHHAGSAWSHLMLVGPLSLPVVAALCALLPCASLLRRPAGAFLAAGALALYGPMFLTGEGNLGAARNWDLFAAPALGAALLGVWLVSGGMAVRPARRILIALAAVSLFHTLPWVAMNTSLRATIARVRALPLAPGRAAMMLGTYHLNLGRLGEAEAWFRQSLREDSLNVNAQSGLGLALARQGRAWEAVAPMSAAVQMKPAGTQYRQDLVALELSLEQWGPAAAQLEALLALDPADAGAWLALASCLTRAGRPDSAVVALETARRWIPANPDIDRALADAYALWVATEGRNRDAEAMRRAWQAFETRFPGDARVAGWRERIGEGR
jgi:Flp pilus assembly protein TadD